MRSVSSVEAVQITGHTDNTGASDYNQKLSEQRAATVKDFLVKHQVPADAWYVSSPNMTVSQTKRLEKIEGALNEFLDKIS